MEAQLLSMPPQVQSLGHSAAFDSLEDSLLRDLEETGMTELANELGLIQDGAMPELQMQGASMPSHLEQQQAAAAQMLRLPHQAAHQRQQHHQGAQPQRQPQPQVRQMGAGQAQRPEAPRAPPPPPTAGPGSSYLGSAPVPFIRQPHEQAVDSPEAGEATMLAADSTAREAVAAVSAVTRRLERLQQRYAEAGPSRSEEDDGLDGVAAAVSPNGKVMHTKSIRCGRGPPESTRGGKGGMRHFSMKALAGQVCEKVEEKARTTYNEVADELVAEFSNVDSTGSLGGTQYDEKNIRRRVYDALNVLMAMEIIAKEKKDIQWKGLPRGHSSTTDRLRGERVRLTEQLQKQQEFIGELCAQQRMFRNLVARNRDVPQEQLQRQLAANGGVGRNPVQLPFILIQVGPEATVEIQITDNQQMAEFDFHMSPFRIMDEDGVLREMGVDQPDPAAVVPTASSRPSSARTTPRGPPSGALQVPQQPKTEGSPSGLVLGFMRQMQQQQEAHQQQVANLQGQNQHLLPPVHQQHAQQQQGGSGLHRQLPPQLVQQQRAGGMHTVRSPTQDVKSHVTLQQLELMNGLHNQLHMQHTQQSPRGSPRISHMQDASPQQAAHYRPGGPMPMQQTPASKPLSTDQSPAPLMPAQLPLHSLHDPQASLVSAPQQMWNFGCQGLGQNASLAQQMDSQPGSFPPQISPILMSQMLQQQQQHHHLSLPMMNGLGQLQNNAAHVPQHPLQRK